MFWTDGTPRHSGHFHTPLICAVRFNPLQHSCLCELAPHPLQLRWAWEGRSVLEHASQVGPGFISISPARISKNRIEWTEGTRSANKNAFVLWGWRQAPQALGLRLLSPVVESLFATHMGRRSAPREGREARTTRCCCRISCYSDRLLILVLIYILRV